MALEFFNFKKAIPVWKKDDGCVMNQTVEFSADIIGNGETSLYIAGCSSYLVFMNGRFIAHGPARTAKGFYKVDCIPIGNYLTDGENCLKIRASGYNMNSFSYIDQPSFICAEIVRGGAVLAATGDNGFSAVLYKNRVQKVPRYSYQRTFCEVDVVTRRGTVDLKNAVHVCHYAPPPGLSNSCTTMPSGGISTTYQWYGACSVSCVYVWPFTVYA